MLWIVGADALGNALDGLAGGPVVRVLAGQFHHATWEGFTFYDLIFPLFVFMVGAVVPFSLERIMAREGRAGAWRRVLTRGAVMYLLGIFYYGGVADGVEQIRLLGVLQRLAICYVAASALLLHVSQRGVAAVGVTLLAGYWALLTFVPVPGFGAGDFTRGHNLANWIDAHYLPLRVWYGDYDPEGLLSTLPAIASCLLGVLAGLFVRDERRAPAARVWLLLASGLALIFLGHLWGLQFPVIKRIWTSSYVLVAGGWSLLLLAGFFHVIEIRGRRAWARPFVWVGSNALAIYLVSRVVDFAGLSARLCGGEVAAALDGLWPGLGGLVLALTGMALCAALCRWLYVWKIFLRI
jgi:predicted acyltransferase